LIELGFAVVFGFSPLAFDPPLMLDPIESDIKGTLRDLQPPSRYLLDAEQDAVPVEGTERYRLENQYLECSLEQVNLFAHNATLLFEIGEYTLGPRLVKKFFER
jgi:hypothetical protein